VIPPFGNLTDVARILSAVDALVLSGGEDVEPARYGAPPHPKLEEVHLARDATEIALVSSARERSLPTLAICRGLQLVNVALGGSLIQDIPSERPDALNHSPDCPRDRRVHQVTMETGSRLAKVFGGPQADVNSIHHQAADRIAEGLRVTAWAPDGIVEGLEWSGSDWWMTAVQWHPEELDGNNDALFRALIEQING
jgi:putative glutamine amidotransferase